MPVLVKLDIHEDSHEIHESGIKLEADAGRKDMIAGGHQSFHCKSSAHGVVYSVLVRDSMLVLNKMLVIVFLTLFKSLMFKLNYARQSSFSQRSETKRVDFRRE